MTIGDKQPRAYRRIDLVEEPRASLLSLGALKTLRRKPSVAAADIILPNSKLCLAKQRIDQEKLRAFKTICGYGNRPGVPLSFLHLPAFSLQFTLLSDASMPLPLLGLVHLENRISRYKPIDSNDAFDMEVYIGAQAPHRLGLSFEVCCDISIDGEMVWRETSTTLCRLPKNLLSKTADPAATGHSLQSASAPCSESAIRWTVPEDTGRRYGSVSGDRNPIHLKPLPAKLFGFKRHIVHGMWTLARAAAEFEEQWQQQALDYRCRFIKPIFLPAEVDYYQGDRNASEDRAQRIEVWNTSGNQCHMLGSVQAR